MPHWNVLVTTHKDGYRRAIELLKEYGSVSKTDYYAVLTVQVADIGLMMEGLRVKIEADADILRQVLARVAPVTHTFHFDSGQEFEARAREIALAWAPQLAGKAFHVRMHRRGFKNRLSSMAEERFLDDALLAALAARGEPGHIAFDEAEAIIMVETLGNQAGLALWSRQELVRYPFLHLD